MHDYEVCMKDNDDDESDESDERNDRVNKSDDDVMAIPSSGYVVTRYTRVQRIYGYKVARLNMLTATSARR